MTTMDALEVGDAAKMLDVSARQVRRLIDRGDIAASRFGGSWAIDRDSVYRYRDLRPSRGRPLSPEGAWRTILDADLHSLDEAHELAIASRRRADRVEARVPAARIDALMSDHCVVESGVGAAARLGAAVERRPPFQCYVRRSHWADLQREYRIDRAHSEPNVVFRIAADAALDGVRPLPRSVVLLDLVSEREHRVASELLKVAG
jgi:excisionase family DNA binding protein